MKTQEEISGHGLRNRRNETTVLGVELLEIYGACAIMVVCECGEERYCYWCLLSF